MALTASQPYSVDEENEIKEGFICPICIKDLGTFIQLEQHFEQAHSGEDKQIFNQLKGLFGKAKEKLTKESKDGASSTLFDTEQQKTAGANSKQLVTFDSLLDPSWYEPQPLGVTRSHSDKFKVQRESKINYVVLETNKLLIRLDKLVSTDTAGMDAGKRKTFEKSVVDWVSDSDVKHCPSCTREFNIIKRRHHCRLCGGVICSKCSYFLPFQIARKLVNPAFAYELKETENSRKRAEGLRQGQQPGHSGSGGVRGSLLKRSDSSSSLNSLMNNEGDPHIRLCEYCTDLLDKRDQQMEQSQNKPILVLLYDKVMSVMSEVNQLTPKYNIMAESLNAGESTYEVGDAQNLRVKLLSLFEAMDNLSKKILMLGMKQETPPSVSQQKLQRRVRQFASDYLQETMLTLGTLPTADELSAVRAQRQAEVQQRVARERQDALTAREAAAAAAVIGQRDKSPPHRQSAASPTPAAADSGSFLPQVDSSGGSVGVAGVGEEVDPLLQQIHIIRGYIRQARQEWRVDEVAILERNLAELQEQYQLQQQRQRGQR